MAKKKKKGTRVFPDGRLVLQYCQTHSFRETSKFYNVPRGWIYDRQKLFPVEYATMKAVKRAATNSQPAVTRSAQKRSLASTKESTHDSAVASSRLKSQSPSVEVPNVSPSAPPVVHPTLSPAVKVSNNAPEVPSQKASLAFLKRGQSLSPLEFKYTNPAVQVVIFGVYLDELRRRSRHGDWSDYVKNLFHFTVRTAQRYRRLAVTLTGKLGILEECLTAVSTANKFPPTLRAQIADAVADATVRKLYLKYIIRPEIPRLRIHN